MRTGDVAQPSRSPRSRSHSSLSPDFPLTRYTVHSFSASRTSIVSIGSPRFSRINHNKGLFTRGYAFVMSYSVATGHFSCPVSPSPRIRNVSSSIFRMIWLQSLMDLNFIKTAFVLAEGLCGLCPLSKSGFKDPCNESACQRQ